MKTKLQVQLEDAYQLVLEGKGAPCPCTMGKKCTKKGCECKACLKSLEESQENSVSSAKNYWPHNPEDREGEVAHIKVIVANVSERLDKLQQKLEQLYGGKDYELPPEIEAMFDEINSRLDKIVPTEDF